MADKTVKSIQTAVGFVPGPYGLAFQAAFKLFEFATGFGLPNPIQAALERLQAQIDQVKKQLAHIDQCLNDLNGRVAQIGNRSVTGRFHDIANPAQRIVFAVSQRPDDGFARRMIGYDAQALADAGSLRRSELSR